MVEWYYVLTIKIKHEFKLTKKPAIAGFYIAYFES